MFPLRLRRAIVAAILALSAVPSIGEAASELMTIRIGHKGLQLQKLIDREAVEAGFAANLKALPDDGRPTAQGTQLVIDAAVLDDPKAKNYTPQQLMDLSFLP